MRYFEEIVEFTLKWEGGYTPPPDEGNYGISQRWHPDIDVKTLTREQAIEIYRENYWFRYRCGFNPYPLSFAFFECCVNPGPLWAMEQLKVVNGDAVKLMANRLTFYTTLGTWKTNGAGWTNRTADFLATFHDLYV
ncbi:MAG TPA: glycosyl hydrolase 108 family protein [Alphaproteobacteria bacterium]|nr:glycosyl hydrolase 108 family protein [Alphaproteobacteria bacterium]